MYMITLTVLQIQILTLYYNPDPDTQLCWARLRPGLIFLSATYNPVTEHHTRHQTGTMELTLYRPIIFNYFNDSI